MTNSFFSNDLQSSDFSSGLDATSYVEDESNILGTDAGKVQFVFPSDLYNSNDYPGFSTFFISVASESTLAKEPTAVLAEGKSYLNSKTTARSGISTLDNTRRVALGVANTASAIKANKESLGSTVSSAFGNITFSDKVTKVGAVATTAVTTASVVDKGLETLKTEVSTTGTVLNGYKQLKACIVLPTPRIETRYGLSWSEEGEGQIQDLMNLVSIGSGANLNLKKGDTASEMLTKFATATKDVATSAMDNIGGGMFNKSSQGRILGRLLNKASNPRKEQLFRDVNFRDFSFSYTFAPRNRTEALNIEAIIKMFKYHAHPELDQGGSTFTYPAQFDIVHYFKGKDGVAKVNPHMPRHTTSVLTNVSVDYSGGGSANIMYLDGGFPAIITMNLSFMELAILTKEDIKNGY